MHELSLRVSYNSRHNDNPLFSLQSPRNIQLVLKISALQPFDTSLSLLCPMQLGNDPLCSHLPGYTGPVSTGGKRRQVVPALWE